MSSDADALVVAGRAHPTAFTALCKRGYQISRLHTQIGNVLRDAVRGTTCPDVGCGCLMDRILIEAPPRHGKSELASVHFPAWFLGNEPDRRIIGTAYGADLARDFGRRARNVIQSTVYRSIFPGITVSQSSSAADEWSLDGYNGGYIAAGIGGPITGRGAHLLLIEDPVKNREDANSQIYRDKVWDWYTSTAYTRLEGRGLVIVIMTRWHEDDLVGRLLAEQQAGTGDRWHRITFPSLDERGEALWPEKFDVKTLIQIRNVIGARDFAALHMQRPTAEDGAVFRREWMERRWTTLPTDLPLHTPPPKPTRDVVEELHQRALPAEETYSPTRYWNVIQSVDTAFKAGVGSDYSAIATWGTDGKNYYLIDCWRGRVEYPELKLAIYSQFRSQRHRPSAILIEDQASGQSVVQDLRRNTNLPVIPVRPGGSKESRADSIAPLFESGRVYLPARAPWIGDWISEHLAFPNGMHDDMVDTTSLALARLAVDPVYAGPPIFRTTIAGRRRARSAV